MESRQDDIITAQISVKRCLLLLFLYFIGYTMILPKVLTRITLLLNPKASMLHLPLTAFSYILICLCAIWIAKPVWKSSIRNLKYHWKRCILFIICFSCIILFVNSGLSLLIGIITSTSDSQNQSAISNSATLAPMFMLFSTVLFAPLFEETVFRAGCYTCIRNRFGFLTALLLSSVLFGSIHVLDSLLNGDLIDASYLILYTGLGIVLAYGYEKSESVAVSVVIHMINNLLGFLTLML